MIALERLSIVNQYEADIKNGLSFTFPWESEYKHVKVNRFKIEDAIKEWIDFRKRGQVLGRKNSRTESEWIKSFHFRCREKQEIGSSNLSTPTLENAKYLSIKALLISRAFLVSMIINLYHLYPKTGQKKRDKTGDTPIIVGFWDLPTIPLGLLRRLL